MNRESQTLSDAARARMLSLPCEPLFIADWTGVVMMHLEVDAKALQAVGDRRSGLRTVRGGFVGRVADGALHGVQWRKRWGESPREPREPAYA